MPAILGLPTPVVKLALTPTSLFVPGSWTDVSFYVTEIQTRAGKEHAMDRVEAGTCTIKLTGADIGVATIVGSIPMHALAQVQCADPSTLHAIFYGITIKDGESILSETLSDFTIEVDDLLRLLALIECRNPTYYQSAVNASANGTDNIWWYPMMPTDNSGDIQALDFYGLYPFPHALYGPSGFVLHNYRLPLTPLKGGVIFGTQPGVCLYDSKTCADLTNGTGSGQNATTGGVMAFPKFAPPSSPAGWAIDCWVIGESLSLPDTNQVSPVLFNANTVGGNGTYIDSAGLFTYDNGIQQYRHPTPVADGYWHHVGLIQNGTIVLVVDGVPVTIPGSPDLLSTAAGMSFGGETFGFSIGPTAGYIDQVVIQYSEGGGMFASTATTIAGMQGRYTAGNLLRGVVRSGVRIAEVLELAGFPLSDYYIDGVLYGTASSNQGCLNVQGILSPVVANLAADLIGYVEDTESGILVAEPDGTLNFLTRQYPIVGPKAAVQLTLDDNDGNSYLAAGFSAPLDDLDLFTQIIVSPANGVEQVFTSYASIAKYGSTTLRKAGTQHVTNDDARWLAYFLQHLYSSPDRRIESVTVDAATKAGAVLASILDLRVWDCYAVTRKPPNATRYTVAGMIETIAHDFRADPGEWHMTLAIDPYRNRDVTAGSMVFQLDGVNGELTTGGIAVLI
jgi:hypothetical protein